MIDLTGDRIAALKQHMADVGTEPVSRTGFDPPRTIELLYLKDHPPLTVEDAIYLSAFSFGGTIEQVNVGGIQVDRDTAAEKYLAYGETHGLITGSIDEWIDEMAAIHGPSALAATRDFIEHDISVTVEIMPSPTLDPEKDWRIMGRVLFVPDRHKETWEKNAEYRQSQMR